MKKFCGKKNTNLDFIVKKIRILSGDNMNQLDRNNLVVDKIVSLRFYGICPYCNGEYEAVEDENDRHLLTSPHFCPHCNFDIHKHRQEKAIKRQQEIENNKYCQLYYDVIGADECGVKLHPQEQMKKLGYELIDSIPHMIADCWWFTVDRFIEPLPEYLSKMKYTIGEP